MRIRMKGKGSMGKNFDTPRGMEGTKWEERDKLNAEDPQGK